MEDQLNKIGLGKGKKKDGVMEEAPGSRELNLIKNRFDSIQLFIRYEQEELNGVWWSQERFRVRRT